MTISVSDLADELAARHDISDAGAEQSIRSYADQLADPEFLGGEVWTADGDLTAQAANEIRDAVAATYRDHTDGTPLIEVEEAVDAVAAARAGLDAALDDRDAKIRAALKAGEPYKNLAIVTGLSRSALDTIRRGRRSR